MPPLFDSISKIHPPREAWRLKVRVLRTWIVPSFGNYEVTNSMEIVLVDGDSNKIQATVKKQLINRFKESIIEGQTYWMSYFSVVPNQGNYRAAEHEFKLAFLNRTTVIPVSDDDIPKTCFDFCPFDELLKMTEDYIYLVDVIGLLTFVGEEKEYVKDAKVMKMIVLELSSKELTIRCTLFGEYVDEVHRFLGSGYMEQPVVVIQLAKVKFFRGQVGLQNVMHATRLFFNLDLSEVVDFKNRYRIKIAVEDDNGHGVFVLFDREAAYLLKKSCADLFGEVQKDANQLVGKKLLLKIDTKSVGTDKYFETFRVRRVCDDAAIISMFELPNYDANDERTPLKDGKLGKIPSSEDEHIVDKREPCEVLDEGAKVPGLDDISTEIDIVREAGKSVGDSVLVDGKCSLEFSSIVYRIKGLFVPLLEFFNVSFAFVLRSTLHACE
ncbi:Replication protein A 70 kDa DNA-binding subunit A [Arachis hypogaea]|nr:Replication protein A 70 kDa DNA-binding subunit A [Arachis hypogaea]